MIPAQSLPMGWADQGQTVHLIAACRGDDRTSRLLNELKLAEKAGSRTWYLACDFEDGGPWAGIRDLLSSLVTDLAVTRPDLVHRHSYELVHVLPTLRKRITVEHESLTDVALGSERVRNFPADRAFRIVHGLINFLEEAHQPGERSWVLACDALDRTGSLARRFFQEVLRRRGRQLGLVLLGAIDPEKVEEVQQAFSRVAQTQVIYWNCSVDQGSAHAVAERRQKAEDLERRAEDSIEKHELIPDLIRAWRQAGDRSRTFRWQVRALELYPKLGFYDDALRYSEAVLPDVEIQAPGNIDLHWVVFFKTFVSLVSVQRADEALQIAEAEGMRQLYDVKPAYRAQILYLIAMVHVRFLAQRDLDKGEAFLERGLIEVELISDSEDRAFSYVFNRNGLALVRNFQGRRGEAIELCREGFRLLETELTAEKHRLHRSVLLYNMAQVYTSLGEHSEAIAHYSAAMVMDPHYSEYYNERGNLLLSLGRLEEAYTDYKTAIDLSPPYPEVFTNLGQCCRRLLHLDEAMAAYSTALDLKPDLPLAYAGRAQTYDELGCAEEALADYSAALRLEPDAADLLANRATVLYGMGELQRSLADLDRALELSPKLPELYENRAFLLTELGLTQAAKQDLRVLLNISPQEARSAIEEKLRLLE